MPDKYPEVEALLVAAQAHSDRIEAQLRDDHPGEWDDHDIAVLSLRAIAERFAESYGEIALRMPDVRLGLVMASEWFRWLGENHACCPDHGAHVAAVSKMFAATVAREKNAE